jgi:hypothetical protein
MLLYVIRVTLFVRWHFVDNMSIVLDWYLSIAILGEIWVIKMRIYGTNVPPATGHLPIAFKSEILYDRHSLSNETRSLPSPVIKLMICKA